MRTMARARRPSRARSRAPPGARVHHQQTLRKAPLAVRTFDDAVIVDADVGDSGQLCGLAVVSNEVAAPARRAGLESLEVDAPVPVPAIAPAARIRVTLLVLAQLRLSGDLEVERLHLEPPVLGEAVDVTRDVAGVAAQVVARVQVV